MTGTSTPAGAFRILRRRRDRHGRAQQQLVVPPGLPGWRSRRVRFDQLVAATAHQMAERVPEVSAIEFAVEEVPPSSPAPWEDHDVCLSRAFPRDRARGLADRIVVYRRAVEGRCPPTALPEMVALLLAERICEVVEVSPADLLS